MRFFAIILSVIVLVLAVVPCCSYDNCGDELETERAQGSDDEGSEMPCSPFVSCTSCSGICITPQIKLSFVPVATLENSFISYNQFFISFYSPKIWQPPKLV